MKKRGAIDIGNTNIRCGIFDENGELFNTAIFSDLQKAVHWLEEQGAKDAMISDVRGKDKIVTTGIEMRYIDNNLKLPFKNLYKTPKTIGADRIAAMSAAAMLFPEQASIVFDIGTCITIDILDAGNTYSGGNISPGIQMRLKAMQHFTNKLPLSSVENGDFSMGHDTLSALANGTICGILYEMEGYIARVQGTYPEVNIILCGGDAHYFEKQLKYKIFADQNLVLLGLYHLLLFND